MGKKMDLRAEYKLVRSLTPLTREAFDQAAREIVLRGARGLEPEVWVKAARSIASQITIPCGRCGGTGRFVTGMVNGKLTGPGGACFRCEGKGHQTAEDRERNYWYDLHALDRAARAMMGGASAGKGN